MGLILEIRGGPEAGKIIALRTGQSVTVGRAAGKAEFALAQDTFMSGLHFAVECGPSGCRVQDRKSGNGTFLNGVRIQDAMLANGDEIKSGQTIFSVKVVADAKLKSLTVSQSVPQSRPSAAEPVRVPPPERLAVEPKPTPVKPALEPPTPVRSPIAEPAPLQPAMRSADLAEEAAEPRESDLSGAEAPAEGGIYARIEV